MLLILFWMISTRAFFFLNATKKLEKDSPYDAFFFETKGVTNSNANEKQFEFVLVDAPYLYQFADKSNDEDSFREHLSSCDDGNEYGCVFPNLNRDAILVAPRKLQSMAASKNAYGHLAAFVRRAPKKQIQQVFQLAIGTYYDQLLAPTGDSKKEDADDDNDVGDNAANNNNVGDRKRRRVQQQQDQSSQSDNNKNNDPIWFSTSGSGVAWLHFRLDSRPKYYTYKPFKIEK